MLTSVYLKTLRDLREQILVWAAGVAVLGAANVLFFPSFQNMPGLLSFLDNLSPSLKALLGDVHAMATPEGFLRVKLFEPLPLLLSIFGVSQAAQLLAGEAEARTIDLLLSRPVSRRRVVVEKYLAVATGILFIAAGLAVGLWLSLLVSLVEVSWTRLAAATLCCLPLTCLFSALALLGSSLLPRARRAALLAGVVVVASYVLETLRVLSPALARWRPLSLFAHQKEAFTLAGAVGWGELGLLAGIAILLVTAAVATYERRDVTV
jgi:ABC-2 type transport system permease protein